jgi:hypothetical protein
MHDLSIRLMELLNLIRLSMPGKPGNTALIGSPHVME